MKYEVTPPIFDFFAHDGRGLYQFSLYPSSFILHPSLRQAEEASTSFLRSTMTFTALSKSGGYSFCNGK
ncbi:hypothetical protein [Fortiea contorta]|uniref:hypothetical protein n=1 Tax=Fortiea contorta TaxID=1892405 RepID=UPI0012B658BE|nr:hypothetical protein [Fortiea contorta]